MVSCQHCQLSFVSVRAPLKLYKLQTCMLGRFLEEAVSLLDCVTADSAAAALFISLSGAGGGGVGVGGRGGRGLQTGQDSEGVHGTSVF